MPKRQEVDISTTAEVIKLWVDGQSVKLKDGSATIQVPPGNHALTWTVRGAAGTQYTVKITSPDEAKFSHSDTFDDSQFDAGLRWFTVKASDGGKS